jgi:hypothetical protein
MSGPTRLRLLYLSHLSQPAADRPVYRAVRQTPVRSIVELGLGTGQRALRMIEVATLNHPIERISYTGIDLFEARGPSDGPGLPLKEAHRLLKATGARIRLVPGDPWSALSRTANTLTGIDLVIVGADQDPDSLARAWFFLPRMLHENSKVLHAYRGERDAVQLVELGCHDVSQLATRRRAA